MSPSYWREKARDFLEGVSQCFLEGGNTLTHKPEGACGDTEHSFRHLTYLHLKIPSLNNPRKSLLVAGTWELCTSKHTRKPAHCSFYINISKAGVWIFLEAFFAAVFCTALFQCVPGASVCMSHKLILEIRSLTGSVHICWTQFV